MAPRVLVLVNGHLVASGDTQAIRDLIADRPRSIRLRTDDGRGLGRELVGAGLVESVRFEDDAMVVASALTGLSLAEGDRFRRRVQ